MGDRRPMREEQAPSIEQARQGRLAGLADEERCHHLLAAGRRCRGVRWQGSEFCFWHDPRATEARVRARCRTSARNKQRAGTPEEESGFEFVALSELQYLNPLELRPLLARTLARLEKGPMGPGIAYAIGYLVHLLANLPPPPEPKKRLEDMTPEEREARQRWLRRRVREIYGWPPEETQE
ncbi:MAG: hypothetical protein ACE5H2_02140 [Terriglobia bacterium]